MYVRANSLLIYVNKKNKKKLYYILARVKWDRYVCAAKKEASARARHVQNFIRQTSIRVCDTRPSFILSRLSRARLECVEIREYGARRGIIRRARLSAGYVLYRSRDILAGIYRRQEERNSSSTHRGMCGLLSNKFLSLSLSIILPTSSNL